MTRGVFRTQFTRRVWTPGKSADREEGISIKGVGGCGKVQGMHILTALPHEAARKKGRSRSLKGTSLEFVDASSSYGEWEFLAELT